MAYPFPLWAFDVGVNLGFCAGDARSDRMPVSTTFILGKGADGEAGAKLVRLWQREIKRGKPALVFKEASLLPAAMTKLGMASEAATVTHGLHYLILSLCKLYGIPCRSETDSRIRKHFIGAGKLGTREATNRAVVSRAQVMGYMPRDQFNWDRANACAAWDYAKANFAKVPPEVLHLYGEQPK